MRRCPGCGFLVPPSWAACRRCGATLAPEGEPDRVPEPAAVPAGAVTYGPTSAPAGGWAPPPLSAQRVEPGVAAPDLVPDTTAGSGRKRRRRGVVGVVAAVCVVAAAAGGLAFLLVGRSEGHHYPSHWDARVAPIATEVAKLRGLGFKHPVPVDFLSDAKFRKLVTADDSKLSASDRRDIRKAEGEIRALGLTHGKVDLFASSNQLSGADTLALYDFKTKRIRVRAESLDVATRVTLAHEMTHALQDQYFDLTKMDKDASKNKASLAETALVEGDAVRIENAYTDKLSPADKAAYDRAQSAQGDSVRGETRDVPEFLVAVQWAPYALGEGMVDTIKALHGAAGIDDMFRDPPRSDLDFYAPIIGDAHPRPVKVPTPAVRAGERRTGTDNFGPFALYLTFASRIPAYDALGYADQWGGDAMVEFNRGSVSCIRDSFVGRTTAGTAALGAGWRRWLAAMPAGSARVETIGGRVVVTACDPGANGKVAAPRSANAALGLAVTRQGITLGLLNAHAPKDVAQCAATAFAGNSSAVAALSGADEASPEVTHALRAAVIRCRDSATTT